MPHIYSIITNGAFPPATVKMRGEVFDQAWASVEHHYADRSDAELDLARLALAKSVVMFAGLGNADPEVLKGKALRIMQMPSGADIARRSGGQAHAES